MARDPAQELARQLWLQSMLSNRQVSSRHAEALYRKALSLTAEANGVGAAPLVPGDTALGFVDFCSATAQLLERVGMDLRFFTDQESGVECLALVNARDDIAAQEFGSAYSKLELAYIKRVIKAMMTAPGMRYSVPYSSALRLAGQEEGGLTRRAAQDLIYNLQLHGWFALVHNNTRISLALRGLLELRDSLANEFDVRKCAECSELVVSGAACGNAADGKPSPESGEESETAPCTFAFHARCSKAALSQHIRAERAEGRLGRQEQGPATCPQCKGEWNPIVVGEDGGEDADESHVTNEEDGDDDDDPHVPIEPRAQGRTTRSSARSFLNDELADESDEDEGSERERMNGTPLAGINEFPDEGEELGDEDDDEDEPPRTRRRHYY